MSGMRQKERVKRHGIIVHHSVTQSRPTLCNCHGLQQTRLPYPSPSPGACSLMSIESVMPSNYLVLCRPLLLLPSIFPSIRVFSNELCLHNRWPKYWNFSISPSNEYSGLTFFRIDWFDLLVVQGILRSLLQKHQFFGAQPLWFDYYIHT